MYVRIHTCVASVHMHVLCVLYGYTYVCVHWPHVLQVVLRSECIHIPSRTFTSVLYLDYIICNRCTIRMYVFGLHICTILYVYFSEYPCIVLYIQCFLMVMVTKLIGKHVLTGKVLDTKETILGTCV